MLGKIEGRERQRVGWNMMVSSDRGVVKAGILLIAFFYEIFWKGFPNLWSYGRIPNPVNNCEITTNLNIAKKKMMMMMYYSFSK